jgi:hypothetical protein
MCIAEMMPVSKVAPQVGKVGQGIACLTVLPVLHSLKLCFSGAAWATNVCPAWMVLTSESVKDVKEFCL